MTLRAATARLSIPRDQSHCWLLTAVQNTAGKNFVRSITSNFVRVLELGTTVLHEHL